jgi:hypothetical protein
MVTGDGAWYLVDLPGYGFANAPEKARKMWALFTREYLLERENLLSVMPRPAPPPPHPRTLHSRHSLEPFKPLKPAEP